jgi:predicted porin
MNKKAIALAVGALCAAPAAHAQIVFGNDTIGTVQIYGKLYPQFASYKSTGATQAGTTVSTLVAPSGVLGTSGANNKNRFSVDSQNSYVGFRGERTLGAGLKAIWQVEQSVGLDGNVDTDSRVWANRNSFAGLSGRFGTVKLGNMDTIYKEYGDTFSMFGISSGNFVSPSNTLSHIGVGNSRTARFHERAPNSIQYLSPEFGGFQAGIQYSPDELKGDTASDLNAELWSFGVKYDSKAFYVSVQHERHKDFFGGSNNVAAALSNVGTVGAHSRDVATRLSGEWRFGEGHRLVGDIARLEYKETGQAAANRFVKYERTNWALGWDARWSSAWRTAIQYIRGTEGKCTLTATACSTTGLDGNQVNLGVAYYFDRQTFLYGIAARLTNGPSARFDNWGNGSPARGADTLQMAVGVSYTF